MFLGFCGPPQAAPAPRPPVLLPFGIRSNATVILWAMCPFLRARINRAPRSLAQKAAAVAVFRDREAGMNYRYPLFVEASQSEYRSFFHIRYSSSIFVPPFDFQIFCLADQQQQQHSSASSRQLISRRVYRRRVSLRLRNREYPALRPCPVLLRRYYHS